MGFSEATPSIHGESLNNLGGGYINDFYAREFWRFSLLPALPRRIVMFPSTNGFQH